MAVYLATLSQTFKFIVPVKLRVPVYLDYRTNFLFK